MLFRMDAFLFGRKVNIIEGTIPISRIINPEIKKISWEIEVIKVPTRMKDIPTCIIDLEFNLKKCLNPFFTVKFFINL